MKTSKRIIALLMALTMSLIMFSSTVWASEEDHTSEGSDSPISVVEENPTTVSVSKSTLTLFIGKSATLKATVQPEGEYTVQWSSDNEKVATVDSMGKVIAKGAGNCTITATVDDVTATCAVTVKKPTIKLNKTSLSLDVKKTATLKATVDGPSKKVTWKSSNTKIATVDKNGKVKAKKVGKCTITATANGVKTTCKVTVSSEKTRAVGAYKDWLSWHSSDCAFALAYVDKDNIPELVVKQGNYDRVFVLSYVKGSLIYDYDWFDFTDEWYPNMRFLYYKKKGVCGIKYGKLGTTYDKYSKGKFKTFIWSNYDEIDSKKWYYNIFSGNKSEVTKSKFNKALKKAVGSTKARKAKFHKNTKSNRKKYLK